MSKHEKNSNLSIIIKAMALIGAVVGVLFFIDSGEAHIYLKTISHIAIITYILECILALLVLSFFLIYIYSKNSNISIGFKKKIFGVNHPMKPNTISYAKHTNAIPSYGPRYWSFDFLNHPGDLYDAARASSGNGCETALELIVEARFVVGNITKETKVFYCDSNLKQLKNECSIQCANYINAGMFHQNGSFENELEFRARAIKKLSLYKCLRIVDSSFLEEIYNTIVLKTPFDKFVKRRITTIRPHETTILKVVMSPKRSVQDVFLLIRWWLIWRETNVFKFTQKAKKQYEMVGEFTKKLQENMDNYNSIIFSSLFDNQIKKEVCDYYFKKMDVFATHFPEMENGGNRDSILRYLRNLWFCTSDNFQMIVAQLYKYLQMFHQKSSSFDFEPCITVIDKIGQILQGNRWKSENTLENISRIGNASKIDIMQETVEKQWFKDEFFIYNPEFPLEEKFNVENGVAVLSQNRSLTSSRSPIVFKKKRNGFTVEIFSKSGSRSVASNLKIDETHSVVNLKDENYYYLRKDKENFFNTQIHRSGKVIVSGWVIGWETMGDSIKFQFLEPAGKDIKNKDLKNKEIVLGEKFHFSGNGFIQWDDTFLTFFRDSDEDIYIVGQNGNAVLECDSILLFSNVSFQSSQYRIELNIDGNILMQLMKSQFLNEKDLRSQRLIQ